jgi:hypothetical protein
LNVRRLAGLSILLAAKSLCAGQVWADSWQNAVSSRVTTEFESNPALTQTHSQGVWRGLLEPSYLLEGRIGENEIRTGLALQLVHSSNRTVSPDRDSPTVFLNWLRPSEAGEFGISTKYVEVATRDSVGSDATGPVSEASTRTSRALSGSWSKELSERNSLSADTGYEGVSYKGGYFTNYSTRSGGLKLSHISSEQITSFCRVSGNKYVPANGGSSSSLADVTLGLNKKVEYFDWTMQLGKSRVGGGGSSTQGSLEAHYTGQQSQLTLNAGRSVSPSGMGGFVKSEQARANWVYALSEYSNIGIDLAWQKNLAATNNLASANNVANTISGIWVEHSLNPLWKMRTYYTRRMIQGAGYDGVSSSIIGLNFSYDNSDH